MRKTMLFGALAALIGLGAVAQAQDKAPDKTNEPASVQTTAPSPGATSATEKTVVGDRDDVKRGHERRFERRDDARHESRHEMRGEREHAREYDDEVGAKAGAKPARSHQFADRDDDDDEGRAHRRY